jgi:23S rRNA (adenine2503-C2)-methyltransferase
MKKYKVPTGHICTIVGDRGKNLEFLSIGDYGKEKNLKADFMGLTKEINGVPHGELLPLSKKWVITISSQYGCSMNCTFCDVPKVGKGISTTFGDLVNQVKSAFSIHPEVKQGRINLHYARMGEPTYNPAVIESAYYLRGWFTSMGFIFHPVVSTMMPKYNRHLRDFLLRWCIYKNTFNGDAGLQLSINTTNEAIRKQTMPHAISLDEIGVLGRQLPEPCGRKYTLNFALTEADINPDMLLRNFDPSKWICKITPMHKTKAAIENNQITNNGYDFYYPYKQVEEDLKNAGYDVIVFIPSKEEDESRITCGNVILAEEGKNDPITQK